MAEKTVAEKMLIKPGTTLWCSDPERQGLLGPLPEDVRPVRSMESATTAVIFAESGAAARALLETHRPHLGTPPVLWVAYPKGNKADINRDTLWPMLTEYGLRPTTQVSVDEEWSALRFRALREGEVSAPGAR
ncbi:DUF3052 domain-containing protein [Georgenia sp. AZ-5]|uniref:DUF3052 domain-containing protein n=1 Tax=Georgenia sp. AZ-5 TaxID=3367526 RepID=UPI0037545C1B